MPYILIPGADGMHRSVASPASVCQERAKRKQSIPSRGRARVRSKGNSSLDSSNAKGTVRGQILGLQAKVIDSEDRVNVL